MLLSCRHISKSYSGVRALDDVNLELGAGEIHGIVGANGAGKSTLMKILSGALPEHEGSILFEEKRLLLSSPHEALNRGIAMVYQELSGVGQLSVAENIFLGRQIKGKGPFINWRAMKKRSEEILKRVDLEIDVTRRLDHYSLSIRQLIEIARCLDSGSRLFILDEPTSALSPPEKARLFELIRQLRSEGKGIIFISHFIEEVLEICDQVTILVNGRLKTTRSASGFRKHEVIHEMLDGLDLSTEEAMERAVRLPPPSTAKPLCEIKNLTLKGILEGIDFVLRPGESLGLYGFVGAGHQEATHCLFGSLPADSGRLVWEGREMPLPSPAKAVALGIAFVAADRASTVVQGAENFKNITLAHLKSAVGDWVIGKKEVAVAQPVLHRVKSQPPDPFLRTGSLSGGNQQKIVLAKWLLGDIRLLVLEEPTRGMDVGAKMEVMDLIGQLKTKGTAVLIASSEPELLLSHADRILIMRQGKITGELSDKSVDKEDLMRYA